MAIRSTEHVRQINSNVSISIPVTLLRDESGPMPEDENEPRSTLARGGTHYAFYYWLRERCVDLREMMWLIDLVFDLVPQSLV